MEAAAGQTLWTRSFIVIWLVNFLGSVWSLLLMIVMAKVATDRFGVSPAVAGLSASIFIIGSFVTRPVLGKRIHRIGQTKVLYIALDNLGALGWELNPDEIAALDAELGG